MTAAAVTGMNSLTVRWAGRLAGGSGVLAAPGVWPLLGLLASGADPASRRALTGAMGVPAEEGRSAAADALDLLARIPHLRSAVGLWTRRELPLHPQWREGLGPDVLGSLSGNPTRDAETLDRWAADRTGGLIDAMPIRPDKATRLVLATALAVRTTWREPFTEHPWWVGQGPWAGPSPLLGLSATTPDLARVRLFATAHGPVTVLRVPGDGEVDVHLLLGEPDRSAAEVLSGGLPALFPGTERERISEGGATLAPGEPGPGLVVRDEKAWDPAPKLSVITPGFEVSADHDLLAAQELFGLGPTTDGSSGHFPGISPEPLAISQARQSAVATFSARGFEAAAVTGVAMFAGAAPAEPPHLARRVRLSIDRPFGFAAVHRPSGLVLACGWVAQPRPYPDEAR